MSLFTDEEMDALFKAHYDKNQCVDTLLVAFEAAILAKLASAELPEPCAATGWGGQEVLIYTADQLRQAYAQGAAAQLSERPSAWKWKVNRCHQHLEAYPPPADAYDEGTLIELYTRREA